MALTAQKVSEILDRQGVDAIVRVYVDESFDPSTNLTTRGEPTNQTLKAIPPYRNTQHEHYQTTELISYGRGFTGFANQDLDFDVKPGILITINGKTWAVIGVEKITNKNGILLFVCEIESGAGYDVLFIREIAGTTGGTATLSAIMSGAHISIEGLLSSASVATGSLTV